MTSTTPLGYVADFCPVCVALRVCALERLEDGDAVEEQRVCMACKVAVRADAIAGAFIGWCLMAGWHTPATREPRWSL